jgi:pyruvate/2-oxoglutarate dehydrogenase complex dihydrolipoamide dehydrogenase (E3) component
VTTYDMLVIGGGTAGLVTAAGSAGLGARVALVERARLGGECLWNGCVPSKALIAAARAASDARRADRFGVHAGPVRVEMAEVRAYVESTQARIAPHDSPERFRGLGVEVIQGDARFTGPMAVEVDGRPLRARRIVIATGSSPAIPPIPGLDRVPYLTNETIFSLDTLPATLLVLGGGPIGIEFAQAFARLGSTVHVVEASDHLLAHDDRELADLLASRLREEGVQLHLGATVTRVERAGDAAAGAVRLVAARGGAGAELELWGDALLVATGRRPRVESLDLARAGVQHDRGGITVNDSLRTTAEGIWAAGDCVGPLRFTHVADYQARLVIRNAFFPFSSSADYATVAWVTYTDPELAHVGLTEAEARDIHGDAVRIWRRPFAEVDRAITEDATTGLVKLVTDARGHILGGHILGKGAGNMIGEITLAMKHGISATALGNTIHPYPTMPEAIKQAAEQYTKSRFQGLVKRVINWYVRRQ